MPVGLGRRHRRILTFGARAILTFLWWDVLLRRLFGEAFARRGRRARYRRLATHFRDLAAEMGGVMIKVGQFLSSRVDALPRDITDILASLQDAAPPEDFDAIRTVLERELGSSIAHNFVTFQRRPQAAASLGQTHRATLADGSPVIVKIQRPRIDEIVAVDLDALGTIVRWLRYFGPVRRRFNLEQLLKEFSETTLAELDYVAEGHNAERFAEMFAGDPGVVIPDVYWDYTTRCVLVLEDVESIKITDFKAMQAAGISPAQVAQRVFRCYFTQIFDHSFFHADPHPGNLFVHPLGERREGRDGRPFVLIFVDFGMVGRVTPQLREAIRESVISAGTRDVQRIIGALRKGEFLLPSADVDRLTEAAQAIFDRFWGMSVGELANVDVETMHAFTYEFRDVLFEMPLQVPHNAIFLGRTIGLVFALVMQLDPDFNFFGAIQPYAQRLMDHENGQRWRFWLDELARLAQKTVALPGQLERVLGQAERGKLSVLIEPSPRLLHTTDRLELAIYRLQWAMLFVVLFLAGILLYVNAYVTAGIIALAFSLLPLLALLWPARRSP